MDSNENAASGVPKQRPTITGETTVAELAAILRAHEGELFVWTEGDRWGAERIVSMADGSRRSTDVSGQTLHEAVTLALRHEIEDAS